MVWLKECAQENSAEVQQKSKGGGRGGIPKICHFYYFIFTLFYFIRKLSSPRGDFISKLTVWLLRAQRQTRTPKMKGGRCGRESGGCPGAHQGAEQQNHKAGDTLGAKPGSAGAVGSVKAGAPLRRHPAGLGLPPTPSSERGHGRCGGLCRRVAAGLARWPCCSCSVSGEGSEGCAGRASLPPSSPSSRAGPVAAAVTQERGNEEVLRHHSATTAAIMEASAG